MDFAGPGFSIQSNFAAQLNRSALSPIDALRDALGESTNKSADTARESARDPDYAKGPTANSAPPPPPPSDGANPKALFDALVVAEETEDMDNAKDKAAEETATAADAALTRRSETVETGAQVIAAAKAAAQDAAKAAAAELYATRQETAQRAAAEAVAPVIVFEKPAPVQTQPVEQVTVPAEPAAPQDQPEAPVADTQSTLTQAIPPARTQQESIVQALAAQPADDSAVLYMDWLQQFRHNLGLFRDLEPSLTA